MEQNKKDEMISAITGLLPYPEINCSLKAVRIARNIYELFEENYQLNPRPEKKPEIDKSLIRF